MVTQTIVKACPCHLDDEALIDLFNLWENRRGTRTMPSRTDFQFSDFRPWLGSLVICRFLKESREFTADLFGTCITEWAKFDLTNQIYSEAKLGAAAEEILKPFYEAVSSCVPILAIAISERAGGKLTRLILPCSQDDMCVDRLIIALFPDSAFKDYLLRHSLVDAMEK